MKLFHSLLERNMKINMNMEMEMTINPLWLQKHVWGRPGGDAGLTFVRTTYKVTKLRRGTIGQRIDE